MIRKIIFLSLFIFMVFQIVSASGIQSPIAYWKLNETNPSAIAHDSVVGVFNFTVNESTNWVPGKIANGFQFNATEAINITKNITSGDVFSFDFWIKDAGIHNNGIIITNDLGSGLHNNEWQMGISGVNNITFSMKNDSDQRTTVNATLTAGVWNNIAVVLNGSVLSIYKNGLLVNAKNYYGFSSKQSSTYIGAIGDGGAQLNTSVLDEFGIWNGTALNVSEIGFIYNASNGATYPFSGPFHDILINLNNPGNGAIANASQNFSATIQSGSPTYQLKNATLWIWYSNGTLFNNTQTNIITGNTVNSTSFIQPIPLGTFLWNIEAAATSGGSTLTDFSPSNFSFIRGYTYNSETHSDPVTELTDQTFTLNVTLPTGLISSDAYLGYNGSLLLASKSTIDGNTIYSKTLTAPSVNSQQNISFYWELILNEGSGNIYFNATNSSQIVNPLNIDDCSVYTDLVINYTMYDEGDLSILNGAAENTSIEVDATITSITDPTQTLTFNKTYTQINPALICVSSGTLNQGSWKFDVQTQYSATDYVTEFYNIQNATLNNQSFPQKIGLYDLASTDSQEFLVTYKDTSFLPVNNALITLTRKYIGDSTFRTVEAPLTDNDGQTLLHLVLGDVIYTIQVSKNGNLLGTFDNIRSFCQDLSTGDCRINLNSFSTGIQPTDYQQNNNLTYTLSFNRDTRTITLTFSTLDGSTALISLNTTLYNNYNNQTICSNNQVTSSAGTLNCVVGSSFGNGTIIAEVYKNINLAASATFSLRQSAGDIFGGSAVFLALLLMLTIPFMFMSSPTGIIIGGIFGFIVAVLMNVITAPSLIGTGSTVIWVIIAGGILLWKINSLE